MLDEPYYKATAVVDSELAIAGSTRKLRPGMQFSAEIVTNERSLLDRLLSPLSSLGARL
jgi:hypothetical protein